MANEFCPFIGARCNPKCMYYVPGVFGSHSCSFQDQLDDQSKKLNLILDLLNRTKK